LRGCGIDRRRGRSVARKAEKRSSALESLWPIIPGSAHRRAKGGPLGARWRARHRWISRRYLARRLRSSKRARPARVELEASVGGERGEALEAASRLGVRSLWSAAARCCARA